MGERSKQSSNVRVAEDGPSWRFRAAQTLIGNGNTGRLQNQLTAYRAFRERNFTMAGRANRKHLSRFRNLHPGQRCVIIGNGPSLNLTDLSLLRDEFTFGLNRLYLMFDELGFETTYHVVINQLVVQQCADDFRSIRAPLFTTTPNRVFLAGDPSVFYFNRLGGPRFSTDVGRGIWEGATVTYAAMQLAYYMGFAEVVLVGVDHRFAVSGPAHAVVESHGPDASHFDPNYFGKGFKWQLPDLETSEMAYVLARQAFQADGRSIVDATIGGALQVFPKRSLEEALGR